MGREAARVIAISLRRRLAAQKSVRMIFAAAPSQLPMLDALRVEPDITWERVTAFHMDEYLGLAAGAPQLFSRWLLTVFFDHLPIGEVQLILPCNDPVETAQAYTSKLAEAPIDIVLAGIGVNGHLAFNDPPADLDDEASVRIVQLDEACRQQQVSDGCFASLDQVPTGAVTLTVPRLLASESIFCCVPGALKKEAVQRTLHDPISGACPATALRRHNRCLLFLDRESAPASLHTNREYLQLAPGSLDGRQA